MSAHDDTQALSEILRKAYAQIYAVNAMLHGADALLGEAESIPDPDGFIFNSAELVRLAIGKADELMQHLSEPDVIRIAEKLEGKVAV
jgi:hypothetical protein